MRVDLHLHTWVSDGAVSPAELVRLAVRGRLDVIAVTDHDTAAGVAEATAAAAGQPLRVVAGIEISTRLGNQELHVLGYGIDSSAESILAHQRAAEERRSKRMVAMIGRLREMGIQVSLEDVTAAAGPSVRSLGRPHLARALFERRYTRYYSEAFDRFIGDSGPAFVAEGFPSPAAAIKAIHEAGGKSVWAHPPIDTAADVLSELVRQGLDGLECYRPGVDSAATERLEDLARRHGLFPTGGSDWHGPGSGRLGDFSVHGDRVREILQEADVPT